MALTVLETHEYEENGNTYIYTKYQRKDGGITEERRIKSDPAPVEPVEPEPSTEPTMSDLSDKMDAQQSLQLASMQGQADQYTTTLAMQEQINAQQQLILANMQGLTDVYTTLLSMQTPTGTEA